MNISESTLQSLKDNCMTIDDESHARRSLQFISYYRLKAYWEEFLVDGPRAERERYKQGTKFGDGVKLYLFDRELRLRVFDAVERVEVAVRTCWEKHLSKHGEHGYCTKGDLYNKGMEFFAREKSPKEKLKAQFEEYRRQNLSAGRRKWARKIKNGLPPVWVASEIVTFGELQVWIKGLKSRHQKEIAEAFEMESGHLKQVIGHLISIRNICAHHDVLWNREVDKHHNLRAVALPDNLKKSIRGVGPSKLHNTLVVLYYLISIIEPGAEEQWRDQVLRLIDDYKSLNPACVGYSGGAGWIPHCMGFPENWRDRPVWKVDGI